MYRAIVYMTLLGVCAGASAATTRGADSETPSATTASEAAPKADHAAKPDEREAEKDAVKSELEDLRNLVETQSEELQDLRKRLAAVEAGSAASREIPAPAAASPVAGIQASGSEAMSIAPKSCDP